MNNKKVNDKITKAVKEVLDNPKKYIKEASGGTPVNVGNVPRSADRHKLKQAYEKISQTIPMDEYEMIFNQDHIVIQNRGLQDKTFNYAPHMASILEYMIKEGCNVKPIPQVKINKTIQENSESNILFNKTGEYNPDKKTMTLYTEGRHPKDVLRTFTHEMIHHVQNNENRLLNYNINTENINESEDLKKIEEEAYSKGNMIFRGWEDKTKTKQN